MYTALLRLFGLNSPSVARLLRGFSFASIRARVVGYHIDSWSRHARTGRRLSGRQHGRKMIPKVIITGAGRCGTTFLVQLFTLLGHDTGLIRIDGIWFFNSTGETAMLDPVNAGCEHLLKPDKGYLESLPKVIKDPEATNTLPLIRQVVPFPVERVYLCLRDPYKQARSKARFREILPNVTHEGDENAICRRVHNLLLYCTKERIPYTTLSFPEMLGEDYLSKELYLCRGDYPPNNFAQAVHDLAKQELVHFK